MEKYKTDDQFRKLCGILDRLAFLPPQLVPQELTTREKSTGDIGYLLDYFDCTYVNGRFRYASVPSAAAPRANSSLRLTLRRRRPEFPPLRWNMYDATLQDKDRMNNTCEGWSTGFQKLVGHAHPSVLRLIECLQQNQALVATALTQPRRNEPTVKRVRKTTLRLQNRFRNICEGLHVHRDLPRLLELVGDCIRS